MRQFLTAGAVIAVSISGVAAKAEADLCQGSSQEVGGNWYCKPVNAITYENVGFSGKYNDVTNMDSATGSCSSTPVSFSGPLAPLNGDVTMHIRGPVKLEQFAVYYPTKSTKRSAYRRHGHQHLHRRSEGAVEKNEKRAVGDIVTATINGKVVSWVNTYDGSSNGNGGGDAGGSKPASSDKPAAPAEPYKPAATGDWTRAGYYDAKSQTREGLTFLNNKGGQGSGCWDMSFGNSLSYASADMKSGAATSQTLADMVVPSDTEYSIWSDKPCAGSDCGYYRPGTVAYNGFSGGSKVFLMEFSMPSDSGASGMNADMPAIWILNSKIGRTLQYGKPECSCWTTGCGEFDLFEVLDKGNYRCKSTMHLGPNAGGSSNFFQRPTGSTIKAAVMFNADNNSATIQLLGDDTTFSPTFSSSQITSLCSKYSAGDELLSVFKLPLSS